MDHPLVSIICTCKNSKQYISQCIESVLRQDYPNFEFIIQDGASTDGTVEIIEGYRDTRIKMISRPDSGSGEAFVNAINRVRGNFWGSCLSDEEMLQGAISWAVNSFDKHPDAAAIYGDVHIIDENGDVIQTTPSRPWNFQRYLCCEIVPPFSASFFRTTLFRQIGYDKYNECGEFDLWLRLGCRFPIYYVPFFAANFRRHSSSNTSTVSDFYRTLPGRIKAIEEICNSYEMPDHIRQLKGIALAGLHLWVAENFITHGHHSEAGAMIVASLDYTPRREYLEMLCRAFANAVGFDAVIGKYQPVMLAVAQYFESLDEN